MIVRVFRARIIEGRTDKFAAKFRTVSVEAVTGQPGFVSVSIGRPTRWTPREFVMISRWESVAALEAFAGPEWDTPHIPPGMEEFIEECWIHHYEEYD